MTLALDGVTSGYGSTTVLRDVSLTVPEGSVVALLGANGAGKTTLLRTASGLLRPSRGRLLLDGADVTGASPHRLAAAGVSHIPEGRGIFRSLTVAENIRLQARPDTEDDALDLAVEAFPALSAHVDQVAGTLSGGEQQMVALARAYVRDARVVLLDEVSMGLAPVIVDAIFDFLARLAGEGRALLIVEQYVHRVLEISDYVYILTRGEVAFAGEPGELDRDEVFERYVGGAMV